MNENAVWTWRDLRLSHLSWIILEMTSLMSVWDILLEITLMSQKAPQETMSSLSLFPSTIWVPARETGSLGACLACCSRMATNEKWGDGWDVPKATKARRCFRQHETDRSQRVETSTRCRGLQRQRGRVKEMSGKEEATQCCKCSSLHAPACLS